MADDTSERHPDFLELCGHPKCFLVNCIKSAGANNIKEDDRTPARDAFPPGGQRNVLALRIDCWP